MAITCELRDKWAAALRSGEYKQGQGALCRTGLYCCLGVLAEVAGVDKRPNSVGIVYYKVRSIQGEWTGTGYPEELAGLDHQQCKSFINMNDTKMLSFSEIASIVDTLECK